MCYKRRCWLEKQVLVQNCGEFWIAGVVAGCMKEQKLGISRFIFSNPT